MHLFLLILIVLLVVRPVYSRDAQSFPDLYSRDQLYRLEDRVNRIENEQSKRSGAVYSIGERFQREEKERTELAAELKANMDARFRRLENMIEGQRNGLGLSDKAAIELKTQQAWNTSELNTLRTIVWSLIAAIVALALPSLRRTGRRIAPYLRKQEDEE